MNISEDTFNSWSQGPSQTESDKCENAVLAVRKAIGADDKLQRLNISVFAQGSYRARTNVRFNSDVDICVQYDDGFFPKYPTGMSGANFGNTRSALSFSEFKNLVQKALETRFGKAGVTRGNKAFDVHANTYRIDADVVPVFEHRRYDGAKNSEGTPSYLSGVAFQPDRGPLVINWPDQVYNNGVNRNSESGRAYKRVIRIFKRLRDKMQTERVPESAMMSSFLIESLIWNAPLSIFENSSYTDIVRFIIEDLHKRTQTKEGCSEWGEVSELKYLFRESQPWTREGVNGFLHAAWNYIGY
jgi:hypothetical protein